jgi:hypothetical protein
MKTAITFVMLVVDSGEILDSCSSLLLHLWHSALALDFSFVVEKLQMLIEMCVTVVKVLSEISDFSTEWFLCSQEMFLTLYVFGEWFLVCMFCHALPDTKILHLDV